MESLSRIKQHSIHQRFFLCLPSFKSFCSCQFVVVRLGAFIQKLLDTQPHAKSLHQDSDADAWRNCFAQLRNRWMKSGAVFEAKNEDKKLKQLVGQWRGLLQLLCYTTILREGQEKLDLKLAVLEAARNTSARRFKFWILLCAIDLKPKARVPKMGLQTRTQKWGQKVDPKTGPPWKDSLTAAPFLDPLCDPTLNCDPIFERKFGTKVSPKKSKRNTT